MSLNDTPSLGDESKLGRKTCLFPLFHTDGAAYEFEFSSGVASGLAKSHTPF